MDGARSVIEFFQDAPMRAAKCRLALGERLLEKHRGVERELANMLASSTYCYQTSHWDKVLDFWRVLSDYLWIRGYWGEYIASGKQALEAAKKLDDKKAQGLALSELGWMAMEQGNFEEANSLFTTARDIFKELGDSRGLSIVLRYLGVAAFRQDDFDGAERVWKESLKIAEAEALTGMIAELCNLFGELARKRGDLEEARRQYLQALQGYEDPKDKIRLTAVLLNLGSVEASASNFETSRAWFEQCVLLCQETGRKDMAAGARCRLAELEESLGSFADALVLAEQARQAFQELGMARDTKRAQQLIERLSSQISRKQSGEIAFEKHS